jgi:hypothetical protein
MNEGIEERNEAEADVVGDDDENGDEDEGDEDEDSLPRKTTRSQMEDERREQSLGDLLLLMETYAPLVRIY